MIHKIQELLIHILKIFWIFKIKENRIVFRSSQGTAYNCSPKYITEYLLKNYPGKFEIIWAFAKPGKYKYLESKGIKVCSEISLKGIYYMTTAKVLVDNHGVQSYIPIRSSQEVINTWHGGGSYKKAVISTEPHRVKYINKMHNETTLFLSSCERYSKCNLSHSFYSHPEKIMSCGLPRNDIFFKDEDINLINKVKKEIGANQNDKIILYAPTYRESFNLNDFLSSCNKIEEACSQRFGGNFVTAIRFHRFSEQEFSNFHSKNILQTNDYEDMQELICACDVVISDYSSCIWDVSLAKKPCFIFATDLDEYIEDRDFYTPISEWPFPLAKNIDELVSNIENFSEEEYLQNVQLHHKALGSYETGTACEQVAQYILSKTQN